MNMKQKNWSGRRGKNGYWSLGDQSFFRIVLHCGFLIITSLPLCSWFFIPTSLQCSVLLLEAEKWLQFLPFSNIFPAFSLAVRLLYMAQGHRCIIARHTGTIQRELFSRCIFHKSFLDLGFTSCSRSPLLLAPPLVMTSEIYFVISFFSWKKI